MNGTFVNGNRLQAPHQLAEGDQIEVGATRLLARLERPEATPSQGTDIPAAGELGATRIADVPSDIPEPSPPPPLQPEPAAAGESDSDTLIEPPAPEPEPAAPEIADDE